MRAKTERRIIFGGRGASKKVRILTSRVATIRVRAQSLWEGRENDMGCLADGDRPEDPERVFRRQAAVPIGISAELQGEASSYPCTISRTFIASLRSTWPFPSMSPAS